MQASDRAEPAGSAVVELLLIIPVIVVFVELIVLGGRVSTASDLGSMGNAWISLASSNVRWRLVRDRSQISID